MELDLKNIKPINNYPKATVEYMGDNLFINAVKFEKYIPGGGFRNKFHGIHVHNNVIECKENNIIRVNSIISGYTNFDSNYPVPDKFSDRIYNIQNDFRLANGFICLQEPENGLSMGFFVTRHTLYAFYGKLNSFEKVKENNSGSSVNKVSSIEKYDIDTYRKNPEYILFRNSINKKIFKSMILYKEWFDYAETNDISALDLSSYSKWVNTIISDDKYNSVEISKMFNDYIQNDTYEWYICWVGWKSWTSTVENNSGSEINSYNEKNYTNDPIYIKAKSDISLDAFTDLKKFVNWEKKCDTFKLEISNFEKFLETYSESDYLMTVDIIPNNIDRWKQIISYDDYLLYNRFIKWYNLFKTFYSKFNGDNIMNISDFKTNEYNKDAMFLCVKKVDFNSNKFPLTHFYDVSIEVSRRKVGWVIKWYVSDENVYTILNAGQRDPDNLVYDAGGYTENADLSKLKIYMGCSQFMDALDPDIKRRNEYRFDGYKCQSALVRIEPIYYNPVFNNEGAYEKVNISDGYFVIDSMVGNEAFFGQGAILGVSSLSVMFK